MDAICASAGVPFGITTPIGPMTSAAVRVANVSPTLLMLAQILWSAVSESSVPAGSNADDLNEVASSLDGASTIEVEVEVDAREVDARDTRLFSEAIATRVFADDGEVRGTRRVRLTNEVRVIGLRSG